MDYLFGPIHSSETPYLTINCVTSAHQINIQQLIDTYWAIVSWGRQVREGLHRLQNLANQGLESP